MIRERFRSFPGPLWVISAVNVLAALAVASISARAGSASTGHLYGWLAVVLLAVPLRFWAVRNLDRWLDRRSAMNAGFAIGIVSCLFYGYAGNQFTIGMSELELYKMAGTLALVSLPIAMVHALFRGRLLILLAVLWLPFLYRMTAPDVQFNAELITAIALVVAVITAVAIAFMSIFRSVVSDQLEQEISNLTMESRQTELQKANSDQHIFFLAANHDIRQPLQAVMAYGVALEQSIPESNTQVRGLLRALRGSIHDLGSLIDETLRFAKISAGQEQPKLDIVSAQSIIDRIGNKFDPIARDKQVGLRYHGKELTLFTDPGLLERVLANLVSNALRYTEQGGVLVAFRPRGKECSVEVWDTGIGITAAEQDSVFQTFYQGSNRKASRAGAQKGHGLGLTIVQQLCEQMGTHLELASMENRGTRVRFRVPMVATRAIEDALGEAPPIVQNFTGSTIAVVEDDRAIRESLQIVLAGVHANVICAASLDEFERKSQGIMHIDFMVADLHVAGGLGTDAILAARQKYPAMDAVIITGDASELVLQRLRRDGFRTMLKPVDPDALLLLIFDAIATRQRNVQIGQALR